MSAAERESIWCPHCRATTPHRVWSSDPLLGTSTVCRLFGAAITLGASELVRDQNQQCNTCGLKRERS